MEDFFISESCPSLPELYFDLVFAFYTLLVPVLLHFREESKKEKAAKPKPVDDTILFDCGEYFKEKAKKEKVVKVKPIDDTILFDCGDLSQPINQKLSWK
jgi:hypothetical protein